MGKSKKNHHGDTEGTEKSTVKLNTDLTKIKTDSDEEIESAARRGEKKNRQRMEF